MKVQMHMDLISKQDQISLDTFQRMILGYTDASCPERAEARLHEACANYGAKVLAMSAHIYKLDQYCLYCFINFLASCVC